MTLSSDKIADLRLKQLEMVQAIIARIANYGATMKNYCITLTTAVCGFAITLHRPPVVLVALLPILVFALLDAEFLRIERRYRALYEAHGEEGWESIPNFSMKIEQTPKIKYWDALVSWAIVIFYLPLAVGVGFVALIAEGI